MSTTTREMEGSYSCDDEEEYDGKGQTECDENEFTILLENFLFMDCCASSLERDSLIQKLTEQLHANCNANDSDEERDHRFRNLFFSPNSNNNNTTVTLKEFVSHLIRCCTPMSTDDNDDYVANVNGDNSKQNVLRLLEQTLILHRKHADREGRSFVSITGDELAILANAILPCLGSSNDSSSSSTSAVIGESLITLLLPPDCPRDECNFTHLKDILLMPLSESPHHKVLCASLMTRSIVRTYESTLSQTKNVKDDDDEENHPDIVLLKAETAAIQALQDWGSIMESLLLSASQEDDRQFRVVWKDLLKYVKEGMESRILKYWSKDVTRQWLQNVEDVQEEPTTNNNKKKDTEIETNKNAANVVGGFYSHLSLPPIRPSSEAELESNIDEIIQMLHRTDHDEWSTRHLALERIELLLASGIFGAGQGQGQYKSILVSKLPQMNLPDQLLDLRSQLTKQACRVTVALSYELQSDFGPQLELCLSSLLQLSKSGVKVMANQGIECLSAVLAVARPHYGYPRLTPKLAEQITMKKNHYNIKKACTQALMVLIRVWEPNVWKSHLKDVQKALAVAMEDRDPGVREAGRKCFWAFCEKYPSHAGTMMQSLDFGSQKRLKQLKSESDDEWQENGRYAVMVQTGKEGKEQNSSIKNNTNTTKKFKNKPSTTSSSSSSRTTTTTRTRTSSIRDKIRDAKKAASANALSEKQKELVSNQTTTTTTKSEATAPPNSSSSSRTVSDQSRGRCSMSNLNRRNNNQTCLPSEQTAKTTTSCTTPIHRSLSHSQKKQRQLREQSLTPGRRKTSRARPRRPLEKTKSEADLNMRSYSVPRDLENLTETNTIGTVSSATPRRSLSSGHPRQKTKTDSSASTSTQQRLSLLDKTLQFQDITNNNNNNFSEPRKSLAFSADSSLCLVDAETTNLEIKKKKRKTPRHWDGNVDTSSSVTQSFSCNNNSFSTTNINTTTTNNRKHLKESSDRMTFHTRIFSLENFLKESKEDGLKCLKTALDENKNTTIDIDSFTNARQHLLMKFGRVLTEHMMNQNMRVSKAALDATLSLLKNETLRNTLSRQIPSMLVAIMMKKTDKRYTALAEKCWTILAECMPCVKFVTMVLNLIHSRLQSPQNGLTENAITNSLNDVINSFQIDAYQNQVTGDDGVSMFEKCASMLVTTMNFELMSAKTKSAHFDMDKMQLTLLDLLVKIKVNVLRDLTYNYIALLMPEKEREAVAIISRNFNPGWLEELKTSFTSISDSADTKSDEDAVDDDSTLDNKLDESQGNNTSDDTAPVNTSFAAMTEKEPVRVDEEPNSILSPSSVRASEPNEYDMLVTPQHPKETNPVTTSTSTLTPTQTPTTDGAKSTAVAPLTTPGTDPIIRYMAKPDFLSAEKGPRKDGTLILPDVIEQITAKKISEASSHEVTLRLKALVQCARENKVSDCWEKHFDLVLRWLLDGIAFFSVEKAPSTANNDTDPPHNEVQIPLDLASPTMSEMSSITSNFISKKLLILQGVRTLIRYQSGLFHNHIEEIFGRLFESLKNSSYEVTNAVERVLENLISCQDSVRCMKCLLPYMKKIMDDDEFEHPSSVTLSSFRVFVKLIELVREETLKASLHITMRYLERALSHKSVDLRKVAVFCIVEMYFVIRWEDLNPHLDRLNPAQRKLVNIYVERHRKNTYTTI